MCYHKRVRYSCKHTIFTIRLTTCHVQAEYKMDPHNQAPCDVKTPHPLHTVSVGRACKPCRRMDMLVKELWAALDGVKAKVNDIEQARSLMRDHMDWGADEAIYKERRKGEDVSVDCGRDRMGYLFADDGVAFEEQFANVRSSW